jgi:hypothetical protein
MDFIQFKMKYIEELAQEVETIRDSVQIRYDIENENLINLKNGYREMADFNTAYSEMGLVRDIETMLRYEDDFSGVEKHED